MTTSPNQLLLTAALVALVPLAAPAAGRSVAIDCEHPYISQRDASRVLRTDNFAQTYDKRQTLYANVARRCHGGVDKVLLVNDGRRNESRTIASR